MVVELRKSIRVAKSFNIFLKIRVAHEAEGSLLFHMSYHFSFFCGFGRAFEPTIFNEECGWVDFPDNLDRIEYMREFTGGEFHLADLYVVNHK
jgi:hypothetical protein